MKSGHLNGQTQQKRNQVNTVSVPAICSVYSTTREWEGDGATEE